MSSFPGGSLDSPGIPARALQPFLQGSSRTSTAPAVVSPRLKEPDCTATAMSFG